MFSLFLAGHFAGFNGVKIVFLMSKILNFSNGYFVPKLN